VKEINPVEQYLKVDRMPPIWCTGCGLGTTVNCFVRALAGISPRIPIGTPRTIRHRKESLIGKTCCSQSGSVPI
jgi:pyruvate/2-oxoacid:ferredoxin oxidoreductase beta subunit